MESVLQLLLAAGLHFSLHLIETPGKVVVLSVPQLPLQLQLFYLVSGLLLGVLERCLRSAKVPLILLPLISKLGRVAMLEVSFLVLLKTAWLLLSSVKSQLYHALQLVTVSSPLLLELLHTVILKLGLLSLLKNLQSLDRIKRGILADHSLKNIALALLPGQ